MRVLRSRERRVQRGRTHHEQRQRRCRHGNEPCQRRYHDLDQWGRDFRYSRYGRQFAHGLPEQYRDQRNVHHRHDGCQRYHGYFKHHHF